MTTESEITRAATVLTDGGCVAFPTETVYGLAADATNPIAVARIFEIKQRPRFDPLIVHLSDSDQLGDVAVDIPDAAYELAASYWPGPLTLVLQRHPDIPEIVTAGQDTVAVRVPDHQIARQLIRAAGTPIAAPSANPFGYVSPTCAQHVADQLGNDVEIILDGGNCRVGLESTIVSLVHTPSRLLRSGAITREDLEPVLGPIRIATTETTTPQAPGQLSSHYAPRTPVTLIGDESEIHPSQRKHSALLAPFPRSDDTDFAVVRILSPCTDLSQAAAALFATMRELDQSKCRHIYAIAAPEEGIGRAINDRLRRAAE